MAGKNKSTDVAEVEPTTAVALPTLNSRQDAVAKVSNLSALRQYIGQPIDWQEIEPSFDVLNQEVFNDTPLVIGGFRFNDSTKFASPDPGNPDVLIPARFVSMLVAAYDPNTEDFTSPWVIVNDGSTGIAKQLQKMISNITGEDAFEMSREEINRHANSVPPILAEKGFRRSDYPYTDEKGNVSTATTWYIA